MTMLACKEYDADGSIRVLNLCDRCADGLASRRIVVEVKMED